MEKAPDLLLTQSKDFFSMTMNTHNVAFYPAHPAQLWIMYYLSLELDDNIKVFWVLRDKDVLVALARKLELEFVIFSKAKTGIIGNALELTLNLFRAIRFTRKNKIHLWLTKYGAGNIAATLCGSKSLSFNDDDIDVVPLIAITSYPFAEKVLCPEWVRMGKYESKTKRYRGMNELIYLHPKRNAKIAQDRTNLIQDLGSENFILIRMSALAAHHDVGIRGISEEFVLQIISLYQSQYKVFISSEKKLSKNLEPYRLTLAVDSIHAALSAASCLVTDSLSMALEAAVLGTASVRLSDFGQEISAFESITQYKLIHNFSPDDTDGAKTCLADVLTLNETGEIAQRSQSLREEMDDPAPYYVDAINEALHA